MYNQKKSSPVGVRYLLGVNVFSRGCGEKWRDTVGNDGTFGDPYVPLPVYDHK